MGISVTYVGQVKNKKPNGLGTFIYSNGTALHYCGYFENGLPQGKGVLILKDKSFVWCDDWKQGKPNGKGANYTSNGTLYVGQFANGVKEGKGVFFYNDNSFTSGNYSKDKMEGRCIYIAKEAKILTDNIYSADVKNGPGYQYELEGKKLYKGTWQNGNWVSASEPPYKSFLTDSRFLGEVTDKQIIMGCANKEGKLQDTAFFRNISKATRYFGTYQNGKFQNGLIIRDDSTILYGTLNDVGATGYCSFFKRGKYYDEGTYVNDFLAGPSSLSIDMEKNSVYYGGSQGKGEFTGKSWFSNKENNLYNGDYVLGKFTGNGWKLDATGYCSGGTWINGILEKMSFLIGPDGKAVNLAPSTLSESLTQLAQLYQSEFLPIEGPENLDDLFLDADYANNSYFKALPASKQNYIIGYGDGFIHLSLMYDPATPEAAAAKYEALCKQVAATSLTINKTGSAYKLVSNDAFKPTENEKSITTFEVSQNTSLLWNDLQVMVIQLFDKSTNTYKVMLGVGNAEGMKEFIEDL